MGPEVLLMDVVECNVVMRVHDSFQVLDITIGTKEFFNSDRVSRSKIILHSEGVEFPPAVIAQFRSNIKDAWVEYDEDKKE